MLELSGLNAVSQEKLQETLALITTLVSPYEVTCEVDGVRVSLGLPLAPFGRFEPRLTKCAGTLMMRCPAGKTLAKTRNAQ